MIDEDTTSLTEILPSDPEDLHVDKEVEEDIVILKTHLGKSKKMVVIDSSEDDGKDI